MGPSPVTTLFWTVAEVWAVAEHAIGVQLDDLDAVLLEVVDPVAADRAACAVDIGDGTAVLSAVEGNVADVMDLAVGHVDGDAIGDNAEVLRAVDVSVGDAGRVVNADVEAGRVEIAGHDPADLLGAEILPVAEESGRTGVAGPRT